MDEAAPTQPIGESEERGLVGHRENDGVRVLGEGVSIEFITALHFRPTHRRVGCYDVVVGGSPMFDRRAYMRAYRAKHGKRLDERQKRWRAENRAHVNAVERKRRKAIPDRMRELRKRERLALKLGAITAYGGKCACCGERELEFLAIDHINGGGGAHRRTLGSGSCNFYRLLKRTGYPVGYRVLCFNCNFSAHLGGGICFHQRPRG